MSEVIFDMGILRNTTARGVSLLPGVRHSLVRDVAVDVIQPIPPGPILEFYLTQVAFIIQTNVGDFQRSFEAVSPDANLPSMPGRELAASDTVIPGTPAIVEPADTFFMTGEILLLPPLDLFPDPDHFFFVRLRVAPLFRPPDPRLAFIVDGESGVGLVHARPVLAAVPLRAGPEMIGNEHLAGPAIVEVSDVPLRRTRRIAPTCEFVETLGLCVFSPYWSNKTNKHPKGEKSRHYRAKGLHVNFLVVVLIQINEVDS